MTETKTSLTKEDIEAAIAHEETMKIGEKTTLVLLRLHNDFEVVGTSSCVDPESYDEEIGAAIARERAVDIVWQCMGFQLQEELAAVAEEFDEDEEEDDD